MKLILLLFLLPLALYSQSPHQRTYCNPMDIGYRYNFEQLNEGISYRSGADGQMFSNTRFGDFPHYLPTSAWSDKNELFTGWMLLSYKKPCTASSVREPFDASRVTDENPRNVFISWDKVRGATGYNILWGIKPDKLYQTYQRFADERNTLEIRALTVGQEYYFAIEAFNENGVSVPGKSVYCPVTIESPK